MEFCPIAPFSDLFNSSATDTTLQKFTAIEMNYEIPKKEIFNLNFVSYGIVANVIISLGIVGNALNLVVLAQPSLKGVTFVYLFWLVIADLFALITSIISMIRLQGIQPRSYAAAFYFAHVEIPLVNAFMASSVFLVIAMTVNRFFSVCFPSRFKELHRVDRARKFIVLAYVSAFVLYIPVCFELTLVPVKNGTEFIACENEPVASHLAYKIFIGLKEFLVRGGPVIVLVVLNISIISTFWKITRKRRDHMSGPRHLLETRRMYEDRRLIALLASIAILFVVCMTPAAVLTILYSDEKEFNYTFQTFRAIANCLELCNYSLNFCVYCLCSPEIRRTFIRLVKCSAITRIYHEGMFL